MHTTDSANSGGGRPLSARDLFTILFRRKATILLISLVSLITVVVGLWLWPQAYEAQAALLVKLGRENLADPGLDTGHQLVTTGLRNEDINSEIRMLTSRSLIEAVVATMGTQRLCPTERPDRGRVGHWAFHIKQALRSGKESIGTVLNDWELHSLLPPEQEATLKIQKKLTVKQLREADVIELRIEWPQADVAQEILEQILAQYTEVHLQAHRTYGDYEFFENQVDLVRGRLLQTEEGLDTLKEAHHITAYEEQKKRLLENAMAFDADAKATRTALIESKARVVELEQQMAALRLSMPVGFQALMTEAEQKHFDEAVRAAALAQRITSIEQQLASYREELTRLERCDTQIRRLTRQIRIDEDNYELYSKKLEEARISEAQDNSRIVNVRVIEAPTASFRPVSPSRMTLLLLGLLLGPLVGMVCAVTLDALDHSIKTHEDVEHYMGLPLLSSVQEARRCSIWTIMKS